MANYSYVIACHNEKTKKYIEQTLKFIQKFIAENYEASLTKAEILYLILKYFEDVYGDQFIFLLNSFIVETWTNRGRIQ